MGSERRPARAIVAMKRPPPREFLFGGGPRPARFERRGGFSDCFGVLPLRYDDLLIVGMPFSAFRNEREGPFSFPRLWPRSLLSSSAAGMGSSTSRPGPRCQARGNSLRRLSTGPAPAGFRPEEECPIMGP